MTNILLIFFLLLMVHYSGFILSIFRGLNKLSRKENIPNMKASVIIPFRNEEKSIVRCLKSIESQEYPGDLFEAIFVNDNSTDSSVELLKGNITSNNIRIIDLDNFESARGHKKAAVKLGIDNSKGDIIVTTDGDCVHGQNWLMTMLSYFSDDTAFVSGPVEFTAGNKLFEKLQKLEFAGLILTGAGLIGNNTPVICNGANSAFRKKVFYEVGGYEDIMNLSSGEDELLMQKIAAETNYKINFCADKRAIVNTEPAGTITNFIDQRQRWASKGLFYKNKLLVIKLILIFLFYASLIIQPLLGLFYNNVFLYSFFISVFVKMFTEFLVLSKGTELLFSKEILKVFLHAEILHVPYIVYSAISGMFGNFKWKERKLER